MDGGPPARAEPRLGEVVRKDIGLQVSRERCQPLIPVCAIPWTSQRWRKRNTNTRGRMEMAVAMKIRWKLTVWLVMKEESATCTVQEFGSWPMTSGHRKA